MKLTHAIAHTKIMRQLYDKLYKNASPYSRIKYFTDASGCFPVTDTRCEHIVNNKVSSISEDGRFLELNRMEGLYSTLLAEFGDIVQSERIGVDNSKLEFEKFDLGSTEISALGKTLTLRYAERACRTGKSNHDTLVFRFNRLIDGSITDDILRSIDNKFASFSPGLNDNYVSHVNELKTIVSESITYIILSYVKTVSEKSCNYLMSNTHLTQKGGSVFNYLKRKNKIFKEMIDGTFYNPSKNYMRLSDNLESLRWGVRRIRIRDTSFIKSFEDKYVPVDSPYDKEW